MAVALVSPLHNNRVHVIWLQPFLNGALQSTSQSIRCEGLVAASSFNVEFCDLLQHALQIFDWTEGTEVEFQVAVGNDSAISLHQLKGPSHCK
eukprot:CAMPEP_0178454842 /NCGR_PEP_ID=MMETSP0689_2-20121128/45587_1 /TAXON_ID=160604 /ORGANISM="Amphidinium massartii, Strain CS-259" /LENGTH=92 /DNA_ID=CAMNT_0020080829 /DNA_START=11 /DNA_END=286 /DNA_ORIENTATION=+